MSLPYIEHLNPAMMVESLADAIAGLLSIGGHGEPVIRDHLQMMWNQMGMALRIAQADPRSFSRIYEYAREQIEDMEKDVIRTEYLQSLHSDALNYGAKYILRRIEVFKAIQAMIMNLPKD